MSPRSPILITQPVLLQSPFRPPRTTRPEFYADLKGEKTDD